MCPNAGNAEASKVCYDHCISITFASDSPPPLYLCIECANEIHREHPNQMFFDILHSMQQVSMVCENKVHKIISFKSESTSTFISRIVVLRTNQLFPFVFTQNALVTTEIILYGIASNATTIGITLEEAEIT